MKKWINILLLLTVALFSLWCTGDLMRKCDQASILAGANDLAHGRMRDTSNYYQIDKTYILYGICAAVLKTMDGLSPVASTNVLLALMFWLALTVFVVRFRNELDPLVLLCFLTAPAVLLNTLYVNSSVLSSAFLLLSAVFLLNGKSRGGWAAALFFFLAVGSRADIILLLPLLLWLITPFPIIEKALADFSNDWRKLIGGLAGFSSHWKLIGAGALALFVGRLICRGSQTAFDPIFNWKMVAGYTVFGFGAAGLLFSLYSILLAIQAVRGRGALEKLYRLAGLTAFLLPVLFFIPQLHVPRYFWRGCEAVLLMAVAGRLPAWNNRIVKAGIAMAALVLMGVGVYLPTLNHPRVTVAASTLFPSGDGFYPMGGYVPFMLRMRHADRMPLDHNQLVWSAVHSAQFDFSPDGTIPVLRTPMYGYFMLEASLRGGFAQCVTFEQLNGSPFYADSRSLMRDDPKTPLAALPWILSVPSRFVSAVSGGIGVLYFGEGGDKEWGRQTQMLNRLFAGNEYRVFNSDHKPHDPGRSIYFSQRPIQGGEQDSESGFYYTSGSGAQLSKNELCAELVLPGWMSMQSFDP